MSDPKNDLLDVERKINFLIQDPKADYFVVASGDIKQAYDAWELKLNQASNSRGILSIIGRSPFGSTIGLFLFSVMDKKPQENIQVLCK